MHDTEIEIMVRSTEIDVNGHVNNAKYLEYLEWGREDWYERLGLFYDVLKDQGVVTVVVHIDVDYKRESLQNDKLRIYSSLRAVGNTSITMEQKIMNQRGELVVQGTVIVVTVDAQTRQKIRVPDAIRNQLGQSTD